jgi:hypothetical protein
VLSGLKVIPFPVIPAWQKTTSLALVVVIEPHVPLFE